MGTTFLRSNPRFFKLLNLAPLSLFLGHFQNDSEIPFPVA